MHNAILNSSLLFLLVAIDDARVHRCAQEPELATLATTERYSPVTGGWLRRCGDVAVSLRCRRSVAISYRAAAALCPAAHIEAQAVPALLCSPPYRPSYLDQTNTTLPLSFCPLSTAQPATPSSAPSSTPSSTPLSTMVYLSTLAQVRAAYQHLVSKANYVSHDQTPDALLAVQMAQLQPDESVLDLGCAGGKITALAKQAVGSGLVVGLDAVAGFLTVDAAAHLASSGLTVAPAGTVMQRVHLVKGSVTDGNIRNHLASATGEPACYDVIFLVHVFETVPPQQRYNLLQRLRSMLAPSGRIIITVSARFTDETIVGPELSLPIQFRSTPYTEAPGSVLITALLQDRLETTADGAVVPARVPCCIVQTAPHRLWNTATEQAQAAARHAGLRCVQTARLGVHNFDLPQCEDLLSSRQTRTMTVSQITSWMNQQSLTGCQYWGELFEALARQSTQGWIGMAEERRDYAVVDAMQQFVAGLCGRMQELAIERLRAGQKGCDMAAHNQLAVLAELRA